MKQLVLAALTVLIANCADIHKGAEAYRRGDCETAYREWKPLADVGNPIAENNIGSLYIQGCGVPIDETEACRWVARSLAHGSVQQAAFGLAMCYYRGIGLEKDLRRAAIWFLRAGSGGDDAQKAARDDTFHSLTSEESAQARKIAASLLPAYQHQVARHSGLVTEKVSVQNGVMVYAVVWRAHNWVNADMGVWNITGTHREIGVDPNRIFIKALRQHGIQQISAVRPEKAVGAGHWASILEAGIAGMGSTRRTADVTVIGVGQGNGDMAIGTVTYSDPELERQRAETVRQIGERQARIESVRSGGMLWPVVLKNEEYRRGYVEFKKVPKEASDILLCVPVDGLVYQIPFHFSKNNAYGE